VNSLKAIRHVWTVAGSSVVILSLSLAVGCSSPAQATPTPTKTPRVEAALNTPTPLPTVEVATASPVPTQAPLATDTPAPAEPAAATETPIATAAAVAELTGSTDAISSDTAGNSSAPVPTRDPNVSPFTGLRPADPAALARRPLAIKVDNDPAVVPQSGLDKADVVVESRKEGCLTRFTAIYQSQDAARVGSIRSARLIDKELPVIFDAVLGFSGAVQAVLDIIRQSDIGDHILTQRAFFRDASIPVPFNLFGNTASVWDTVTQRGWNKPPNPTAAWTFTEVAPPGGASASRVDIPYPKPAFKVTWAYDPASGHWGRSINGKAHVDKVTAQQLTAANVVVLGANHVQTLIPEQSTQLTQGPCSNASVEIQLWGQGPAKILRDGKVYEGKWVRPDRHAPFRFLDAAGKDIPLKPGNSWWEVVPLDMKVTMTQ
jgi:hypothetical protein